MQLLSEGMEMTALVLASLKSLAELLVGQDRYRHDCAKS
jgi:hypothetical protein